MCHCHISEAEAIHWSINSLRPLDLKLSLLNLLKFIFSFESAMLEHSKIFQSRDIECIITPYMPFYLASQLKINNITIQHLYTNWLNSMIIKLYHDKLFVIFSKSFCLQKAPESWPLFTSLCSNNLSTPPQE